MPDDATPARGLALGCLFGALVWTGVFLLAWFVLPGVW
jgi:hypothetical protein